MNKKRMLVALLLALLSPACTKDVRHEGTYVDQESYARLKKNETTKAEVVKLFGHANVSMTEDEWFYIYQMKAENAILNPTVVKTEVVRVRFSNDKLVFFERFYPKVRNIVPVKDKTHVTEKDTDLLTRFFRGLLDKRDSSTDAAM